MKFCIINLDQTRKTDAESHFIISKTTKIENFKNITIGDVIHFLEVDGNTKKSTKNKYFYSKQEKIKQKRVI